MNSNVPSPASLREKKKAHLRAFLEAEHRLPLLVERLSSGLIELDAETTRRWAGWLESLRDDPAWEIIEPALQLDEAWPDTWNRARQAGFGEGTEHHQAIFFARLFERAVEETEYPLARRAWTQALLSWSALADGDYLLEQVLSSHLEELSEEQITELLETLLDGPLKQIGELGVGALRLESWEAPPARRALRFALDALSEIEDLFSPDDGPVARGALSRVKTIRTRLVEAVSRELERRLDEQDTTTVELDELVTTFDCALVRAEHLDHPPRLDRAILRRGLDRIWSLRDIDRDDELGVIPPMVDRLEPCASRLRGGDSDESFGLEGAIADLLVFKGEEALSLDERQDAFERALETCPGHRNASRLLSYLLLERANRDLLKTAPFPEATARIGAIRRRIRPYLERAAGLIDRAETLYPENELLDQYRGDLNEELKRFRMTAETDSEDR